MSALSLKNPVALASSSAGTESNSPAPQSIPPNMLRKHPASLIPRHLHDPILLGLLKAPVNDELIEYVAECTLAVVATPSEPIQLPTPPTTPVKSSFRRTLSRTLKQSSSSSESLGKETCNSPRPEAPNASAVPSLTTFIKLTAARANAQAPTLLVTLVYLDRLKRRLKGAKAAKGMQCTYHRLFLACLIAAAKYCNDCCPRNVHWVKWSGLFTLNEVNLMEQELLMLLDYELRVEESSLLLMCSPFLPPSAVEKLYRSVERQTGSPTCATPSTDSSESREDISTPDNSPVVILLDTTQLPVDASPVNSGKKLKLSQTSSLSSNANVITRAKSWYGNIRAAAS